MYKSKSTSRDDRNRRIVMCGPALGYSNAGDRLLPKTLGEILREHVKCDIVYLTVRVDSRVHQEMPWLQLINPKRHPFKTLWQTFRADAFVIAGAIAFHDHRTTMFKQAVLAWLCRLGGGRVTVNAISIQPMRDHWCRRCAKWICRAANQFTVRDESSVEVGHAIGLPGPISRSCDPGIICRSADPSRLEQIFVDEQIPHDRRLIAIAPHFFVNPGRYRHHAYDHFSIEYQSFSDEQLDAYYQAMAAIADQMTEEGHVVFVPMCNAIPPGDDRISAERIRGLMRHPEKTSSLQGDYEVEDLAGVLQQAQILIASRLHAFAMGMGQGVPSLGIEFHPKIRGLAEELDMVDHVYPMDQLDPAEVVIQARTILKNFNHEQQKIQAAVKEASARARHDFLQGVFKVTYERGQK